MTIDDVVAGGNVQWQKQARTHPTHTQRQSRTHTQGKYPPELIVEDATALVIACMWLDNFKWSCTNCVVSCIWEDEWKMEGWHCRDFKWTLKFPTHFDLFVEWTGRCSPQIVSSTVQGGCQRSLRGFFQFYCCCFLSLNSKPNPSFTKRFSLFRSR